MGAEKKATVVVSHFLDRFGLPGMREEEECGCVWQHPDSPCPSGYTVHCDKHIRYWPEPK